MVLHYWMVLRQQCFGVSLEYFEVLLAGISLHFENHLEWCWTGASDVMTSQGEHALRASWRNSRNEIMKIAKLTIGKPLWYRGMLLSKYFEIEVKMRDNETTLSHLGLCDVLASLCRIIQYSKGGWMCHTHQLNQCWFVYIWYTNGTMVEKLAVKRWRVHIGYIQCTSETMNYWLQSDIRYDWSLTSFHCFNILSSPSFL